MSPVESVWHPTSFFGVLFDIIEQFDGVGLKSLNNCNELLSFDTSVELDLFDLVNNNF